MECDTSKDFDKTVKILEDFWSGNENVLDLSGLKCNMDIPKYFSHPRIINKLGNLGLGSNGLKSLPSGIGNLVNLHTLALQGNELTSLPEEPWDCNAVLRTLDIRLANGIGNGES